MQNDQLKELEEWLKSRVDALEKEFRLKMTQHGGNGCQHVSMQIEFCNIVLAKIQELRENK